MKRPCNHPERFVECFGKGESWEYCHRCGALRYPGGCGKGLADGKWHVPRYYGWPHKVTRGSERVSYDFKPPFAMSKHSGQDSR